MKTLILLILTILLVGCGTVYKVHTVDPKTGKEVNVSVWSGSKDFEAPDLHYSKSAADGVDFSFKAESITDQSAAFFGSFMKGLMDGTITVRPREFVTEQPQ